MITVLAEKFDIGLKIAVALQGLDFHGKKITIANIEANKKEIEKELKPKGVIYITYKGEKYAITWANGHLCCLKQAKDYNPEYALWSNIPMPYFPQYEIRLRPKDGTGENNTWVERQMGLIEQLFNKSSKIICATDDDREGKLIFAYIYQYTGSSTPYESIRIDSQTEKGFKDAFSKMIPASETCPIENAGRCRSIADWITGANISAKMTLKYKKYVPDMKMITIGRIQTAVLNLIVEREKAIRDFVSHPFWNINALFKTATGDEYEAYHTGGRFEDRKDADAIMSKINGKKGVVASCEKKPAKKDVPLLYDQINIAIKTNEELGLTAKQCLDVCQELYEKGYLTYPRTDSRHLTDDMGPVVDEVLDMLRGYSDEFKGWIDAVPKNKRNYTKRHFDTSKVTGHYAIIPTNAYPQNMTDIQKKVYEIVAKSLIRVIYKAAGLEETTIVTNVEGEEFRSSGTVVVDKQWLVVGESTSDKFLPSVNSGDIVDGEYDMHEGKTVPPKRYTHATLVTAMKTASTMIDDEELREMLINTNNGGIGRPSTYGPITDNVINKYCYMKGKSIFPTESGMKVIEMLPIEDLKSAKMTAEWEDKLDKVSHGELDMNKFLRDMEETVAKWCKIIDDDARTWPIPQSADTSTMPYNCPKCGKPMRKYSWGWACSGYTKENPSCRFAISNTIAGRDISDDEKIQLLEKKKTKYLKGFHSKEGESFGAFLFINENGEVRFTRDSDYKCPKCGRPLSVSDKAWGCPGWRDKSCNFTIWRKLPGNKLLTDRDIIDLLEKKKTRLIKGLKSTKKNTEFDAYVKLVEKDGEYKTEFEFPPRKGKGEN